MSVLNASSASSAADVSSPGSKPITEAGTILTVSAAEADNCSLGNGASSAQNSLHRQSSNSSNRDIQDGGGNHEEEDDGQEEEGGKNQFEAFVVSPIVPLKEQLEKDKDDESLRRWKEQLLGSIVLDAAEEGIEPRLQVISFSILSAGRPDIVVPLPLPSDRRSHLFTLKEGSSYSVKFTFKVRCNIVSGLTYIHTVWKNGFKVDKKKVMLGTFGPQDEPYTHVMEEEITPSGIFARGSYTSRIRLVDDDGRVHLEIQHTFNIHKDW